MKYIENKLKEYEPFLKDGAYTISENLLKNIMEAVYTRGKLDGFIEGKDILLNF